MLSLQYIAGFFDGEGNVGIYTKGHRGGFSLRIQLTQGKSEASLAIMQELKDRFGGNIGEQATTSGGTKYNWQLNARLAATFLEAILPHLIIKREQAETAIAWQQSKPLTSRDQRGRITSARRPEDREVADRLKAMKGRQVVPAPAIICRECGAETSNRKRYRVVRKDGDYPGTRLCLSCLEEYRHDSDVLSVEEER